MGGVGPCSISCATSASDVVASSCELCTPSPCSPRIVFLSTRRDKSTSEGVHLDRPLCCRPMSRV